MAIVPLKSKNGPATEVLLVEGQDDFHILMQLREYHRLEEKFSCEEGGGIDTLKSALKVRLKLHNERCLGVIVDADTDVRARWDALRDVLNQAGYNDVPMEPSANGTIVQQNEMPRMGIWIMPNNQIPGMIEDFVRMLVPEGDKLWARAARVVQEIPEGDRLFGIHSSKATIHTWLAWQKEPGTPMGLAIKKRYLRPDTPQALLLVDWLQRLFGV